MAARKKTANWAAIEYLYLQGTTPSEIADVYDVTSKQVRDRAYRSGWRKTKATISDKIASDVAEESAALVKLTIRVHTRFMQKLDDQIDDITNPFLTDGERTNSLFQTAMNNAVKITLNALKDQDDEKDGEAQDVEVVFKKPGQVEKPEEGK